MRRVSIFAALPPDAPPVQRAVILQQAAAAVGFEWPSVASAWRKLEEEIQELADGLAAADASNTEEELGDVLFALANLARLLNIDPERALSATNDKFVRRVQHMEQSAWAEGRVLADEPLAEQLFRYQRAKAAESDSACQRS